MYEMKTPNSTLMNFTDVIRNIIEGTEWEGHVFICGKTLREYFLFASSIDIELVVDKYASSQDDFLDFLMEKLNNEEESKCTIKYNTTNDTFEVTIKGFEDAYITCRNTTKTKYGENGTKITFFGTCDDDANNSVITIDSMYYNISEDEILDSSDKGIEDLSTNTIRAIGDPDEQFKDNPLDILKVIRIANELGWGIEKNTWLGMIKNANKIVSVSQDDITSEVSRIILTDKPSNAIRRMMFCNGLLSYVLPALKEITNVNEDNEMTSFERTMDILDMSDKNLKSRLSALFHRVGKITQFYGISEEKNSERIAQAVMEKMGYSESLIKSVGNIISMQNVFKKYKNGATPSHKTLKKLKSKIGDDLDALLKIIHYINITNKYGKKANQIPTILKSLKEIEEEEKQKENENVRAKLPVNGNDVMKEFSLKQGKVVGKIISMLVEKYKDKENVTKEECMEYAREHISSVIKSK